MPSDKWGAGFKLDIALEGGKELRKKLAAIGAGAEAVLAEAAETGAKVSLDGITRDAPGKKAIVMAPGEPSTPTVKSFEIGPDKAHWYYQFFETGVQPFEIDMVKGVTTRTATDKSASKAKGQDVKMKGRQVYGKKSVLVFNTTDGKIFARKVSRGPMAARPFMRKNFFSSSGKMIEAVGNVIRRRVIEAQAK